MLQTEDDSAGGGNAAVPDGPGVLVVWSGTKPALVAHRLGQEPLILGRALAGVDPSDVRISRQHARVRLQDGAFSVADLGSRNGTFVGGKRVNGEDWVHPPSVVRVGRTLALLLRDVRKFEGAGVRVEDGVVLGPALSDAWTRITRAANNGDGVLLTGESGTGKELAARAFHAATGARGELVAVNCAAIPAGVAERLLFGTRRGAYSGADRDAEGYLAAADGGTLFLDEIGELELPVQAKLLRALETREVMPLGGARPRRLDLRVVAATLRDLRAEVAAGRFREDLYHRVGRPEVRLRALRERLDEVSWLIACTVEGVSPSLGVHPNLVETCLTRPWPGNVRELAGEIRRAALAARDAGDEEVRPEHLEPMAGLFLDRRGSAAHTQTIPFPDAATIEKALGAERGNVTRAALRLGLHRNQLRRFLARHKELAARIKTDGSR